MYLGVKRPYTNLMTLLVKLGVFSKSVLAFKIHFEFMGTRYEEIELHL